MTQKINTASRLSENSREQDSSLNTQLTQEEKLALLGAIVESSGDAIASKTLEGIVTSWNQAAQRVFGYTAAEMIGQHISKLIPEDRLNEETEIINRISRGDRVEHFETQRLTKDKQLIDISLTISPIRDESGKIIGASKIARDITGQKNADRLIRESEERLRMAAESTNLGTWEFHPETGVIIWSEESNKIFSVQPGEKVNYGYFARKVHPDDIQYVEEEIRKALDPDGDGQFDAEFRIRPHTDDRSHWVRSIAKVFVDEHNHSHRFIGTVIDITESKKSEQRKDDFIRMASHELKTPITSIKGYTQLLQNIFKDSNEHEILKSRETVRSSLKTIEKQVGRLTRLVTELLDLSRIETGKLEMNMTWFGVKALVDEVVQDVQHVSSRHAILVQNDFNGSIFGDRDRIGQVLVNLLTNAIKYSPDAHQIEVVVEQEGSKVILRVRDQGIGIDKHDQRRIFERFYRVEGKSEQTYPGFGIGLFIANEIAQRHNGMITVSSEKGRGSQFSVTLPLKPDLRNLVPPDLIALS